MKLAERIFRRSDYYITSPFGTRKDPISGATKQHNGCDYGTDLQNWDQYALEDGKVIAIKTGAKDKDVNGGLGNYVKVEYPRLNIQLLHAHLKKVNVKNGQQVTMNTVLGTTGTTGYSTGIHLHLGLQERGKTTWIDPEKYNYEEEISMPFNIGDIVYAKEDIKLYTSIEMKENLYTLAKGKDAIVKIVRNDGFVALGNPETKEYFASAWTKELDKLTKDCPDTYYKELYEKELLINKDLQAQINLLQAKINKAIDILK